MWTTWPKARPLNPQQYSDLAKSPKQLQEFITSILVVVKQCWAEEFSSENRAGGSFRSAADGDCPLTQESLPLLQTVIGLLYSFVECWRCVYHHADKQYSRCKGDCWFRSSFLEELRDMLLPRFPVVLTEVVRGKKGQKGVTDKGQTSGPSALQDSVFQLNLLICEILSCFPPPDDPPASDSSDVFWQKEIVSFLVKNFKQCRLSCKRLMSILRQVFMNFDCKMDKLVAKVQKRLVKSSPLSREKMMWVDFLNDLVFDSEVGGGSFHPCCRFNLSVGVQMKGVFIKELCKLVVALCDMEHTEAREKMALCVTKALGRCYVMKSATLLEYMPQILDAEKGAFIKLHASCHEKVLFSLGWVFDKIPVPEPLLKQIGLIVRHPAVDKLMCYRLFDSISSRFGELLSEAVHEVQELEDSRIGYISFVFSCLVGHTAVELKAFHEANTADTGGLTRIIWTTADIERLRKHAKVTKWAGRHFGSYIKRKPWDSAGTAMPMHGALIMDIMAELWDVKILKEYRALSVLTVHGALTHWLDMISDMECSEVPHIDRDVYDRGVYQPDRLEGLVNQVLPVFKTRLRPFTKLTFALLYSLVKMEREGKEVEDDFPPLEMKREMLNIVVSLMEMSFRMMVDLVQVMTDFVQEVRSDVESGRVLVMLTHLVEVTELQGHILTYRSALAPQLAIFVDAVKSATPEVEQREQWKSMLHKLSVLATVPDSQTS